MPPAVPMEGTMHPRRFFVSITLTAALLAGAGAHAQDAQRYRLEKSNDGFVRMDTQTGAMSICEEKGAQLVCRAAADERTAFQEEIERLQDQVKAEHTSELQSRENLVCRLLLEKKKVHKRR